MRHIIIDIRPLLPTNQPGGVPEYTKEIVRGMLSIIDAQKLPLRVFLFSSGAQKPDGKFFDPYKKTFQRIHLDIPNRILNTSLKIFDYPKIDEHIRHRLKLQITNYKLQDFIFFAPNINLFPLSHQTKLVVTFHDLSFERYPFFLTRKERIWHQWVNPHAIAKKADKIIAVSESTKQDLVNVYGIEASRVKVVYSGIRQRPTTNDKRQTTKKTVLYIGSTEGRKNIESLKYAFNLVQKRLTNEKLNLIIAGPPHHPVTEKEKAELYQNANLFIYPSMFEGFGFPPLEAMAAGVPVVTSNTSSLPEAVGDAAIMVNPHKAHELAQAMELFLTDENLRVHYVQKGLEHVKKFTWEKTARETLKILLDV